MILLPEGNVGLKENTWAHGYSGLQRWRVCGVDSRCSQTGSAERAACLASLAAGGSGLYMETYTWRLQHLNIFHLCVLLQVSGPSRGLMTNNDCPVTLIHLTLAVFLAICEDNCDRKLGLFLLMELNLVCVSSAQETNLNCTKQLSWEYMQSLVYLSHIHPFTVFVTVRISGMSRYIKSPC